MLSGRFWKIFYYELSAFCRLVKFDQKMKKKSYDLKNIYAIMVKVWAVHIGILY